MSLSVNRKVLDFDFEKICSVTLSTVNIYVCLACGKYVQGRSEGTPAYMHALHHEEHRLYMSLDTLKVYSLPDNEEVVDEKGELNDIRTVISPLFTSDILTQMDTNVQLFQDLQGKMFLPGYCDLNNIKANDYVNVVIQALAHIPAFRDFFLLAREAFPSASMPLCAAWRELLSKLWNANKFKAQTSPHEFLQVISTLSAKRFSLTKQCDPSDLLTWMLSLLAGEVPGLVETLFKGKVAIESVQLSASHQSKREEKPFMHLTLDLPDKPLFSDPKNPSAVPQVALTSLLTKFDGGTPTYRQASAFTYGLLHVPSNLIFYVNRRVKGRFGVEWNDTLVRFAADEPIELPGKAKYRLMANVYCKRDADQSTTYGVHLRHRASNKWLEVDNLQVRETESQLLFMAESLIQFWERI